MQKIVINADFGGFRLSDLGMKTYKSLGGQVDYARDIPRDCPILIKVIEQLGNKANDHCSKLKIVEIPDNVQWEINEYDGLEHVAEKHRTWR